MPTRIAKQFLQEQNVGFALFYNKIFAVTFDENFARATGTRANAYNLLIAVVIAVIIVLAMNLVGSLLISALVIFPALSAMRLFKSFRSVTISAAVLSVLSATAGILISILAWIGVLIYISIRFKWDYAISGIVGLIHYVFFVLAACAIFRLEVNTEIIGVLLTVIG